MTHARASCLLSWFFVLLLAGCGESSDAPSLGDWTLRTDGLTLSKDLQVSETENYFFGSIQDLAVTTEGRMVVLDSESNHLKVLRSDGTLIDTLGRQGQGPGEFQAPNSVAVAQDDSVYVYDTASRRLTVFTPPSSSKLARSVAITEDWGSKGWGYIEKVWVLEDGLTGRFRPYYAREEGFRQPSPASWRVMDETGVLGDTLLEARRQEISISFEGQGLGIEGLPFGRATQVAVGPDSRLYHGWTDSLHVQATSLDGTTDVIATVPTDPVPVTEAERDSALEEIERVEIRRQFEDAFPETKPAFTELIVADDGWLWVERPTVGIEEEARWWRLDPESKTIQETRISADLNLKVVQNGYAYGTTTTEAGAPALVRYQIQLDS